MMEKLLTVLIQGRQQFLYIQTMGTCALGKSLSGCTQTANATQVEGIQYLCGGGVYLQQLIKGHIFGDRLIHRVPPVTEIERSNSPRKYEKKQGI